MIRSKYKSLLNSDIWEDDVLPELNNSSKIISSNITDRDYLNIKKDNILEHLFLMKNGCNWFGSCDICDQLKLYPNQNQISIIVSKKQA